MALDAHFLTWKVHFFFSRVMINQYDNSFRKTWVLPWKTLVFEPHTVFCIKCPVLSSKYNKLASLNFLPIGYSRRNNVFSIPNVQHYLLGQYLRQRYTKEQNFLNPCYNHKEIYVKSTDYDRTIRSALANMAGFVFMLVFPTCSVDWNYGRF